MEWCGLGDSDIPGRNPAAPVLLSFMASGVYTAPVYAWLLSYLTTEVGSELLPFHPRHIIIVDSDGIIARNISLPTSFSGQYKI